MQIRKSSEHLLRRPPPPPAPISCPPPPAVQPSGMFTPQRMVLETVHAHTEHLWLPAPHARVYSCSDGRPWVSNRKTVVAAAIGGKQHREATDRRMQPAQPTSVPAADEQAGWLWRRDASTTQKQLKSERIRPKKCVLCQKRSHGQRAPISRW